MPSKRAEDGEVSFGGFAGLDRLFEHRVRLAVCVLLSRYRSLSFRRLKELLEETDGSLGAHLRRLEEADYVKVKKEFRDRKPVSWYSLTRGGTRALSIHVDRLQSLLQQVNPGESAKED